MDDVFELIGKVVAAVGGAGVIIIGISSWISKLWAKWFMEKEKQKFSKDIEIYKHELQKEIEITRNLNEQMAYRNKVIFDSEYKYYEEIAPKLIAAGSSIQEYLATQDEFRNDKSNKDLANKMIKEKYDVAHKRTFEFYDCICKYSFFVDKAAYEEMVNYFGLCLKKLQAVSPCNSGDKRWINWEELLEEAVREENQVIDFLRNMIRR